MKQKMLALLIRWTGAGYLERALSLLPFNGRKTLLAGVATSLAVLYSVHANGVLEAIMKAIEVSGGVSVLAPDQIAILVSAMATVLSLLHKALKALVAISEADKKALAATS